MTPNFYILIKVSDGTSRIVWSHHRFPMDRLYESKHTGKQYVLREHIHLSDADIQPAKELPLPIYFVPIATVKVIEVQFPTGKNKGYFYYIKEEDAARYTVGDKITIDAAQGRSTVTVKGIYYINQTSVDIATKLLPIVEENKYVDIIVKFLGANGYSHNYCYTVSNIYTINKHDFIYLIDNKCIVKVVGKSAECYAGHPTHRFKSIGGVDRSDIENQLMDIKKLNPEGKIPEEIKDDVIKAGFYFDFFHDTTTTPNKYENLNKLASGITQAGQAVIATKETFENLKISINKENDTMNMNKIFGNNFIFGKLNTNEIKFSPKGLAFRTRENRYNAYSIAEDKSVSMVDVTPMVFDFDFVFVMPVALKDVKIGDILRHMDMYVVVKDFYDDGTIAAICPQTSTEVTVIPMQNMFGFNYVTKIMNMFEGFAASAEQPFGDMNAMLPFMFMGDKTSNGFNMKDFLMLSMMSGNSGMDFASNPMLMMAMMQD